VRQICIIRALPAPPTNWPAARNFGPRRGAAAAAASSRERRVGRRGALAGGGGQVEGRPLGPVGGQHESGHIYGAHERLGRIHVHARRAPASKSRAPSSCSDRPQSGSSLLAQLGREEAEWRQPQILIRLNWPNILMHFHSVESSRVQSSPVQYVILIDGSFSEAGRSAGNVSRGPLRACWPCIGQARRR